MKKSIIVVVFLSFCLPALSLTLPGKNPAPKATEIFIPIGNKGDLISIYELSQIKPKELQKLTGKKMNLMDRMSFKVAQKKLRNNIARDGSIKDRKFQKYFKRANDGRTGFHLGGFALGFFVGLIGVIIAYIIEDDKKRNRVKWAWLGLAAGVVLSLIIFAAIL